MQADYDPYTVSCLRILWTDPDMPHFTIEYSANLDTRVDMGEVVEIVRKAAVETGIFPLGGIRVRAIRCEHYAIAAQQHPRSSENGDRA